MILIVLLMSALLFSAPLQGWSIDLSPLPEAPYISEGQIGEISNSNITEASGMAVSSINTNLLWIVNDSGNPPVLFGVSPKGKTVCEFTVTHAENIDWEDLALFSSGGSDYLVIADVGDNKAERDFCTLYIVQEPEADKGVPGTLATLSPVRRIDFRYEDGPRDCEAVAVDAKAGRILLISKRTKPPVLYELPLEPETQVSIARAVASLITLPEPTREDESFPYGHYWSRPTAMDLSPDGRMLIILTYKDAYCFTRTDDESWDQVLSRRPARIRLPHPATGKMIIRESLAVSRSSGDIFITSERIPAPIYHFTPLPVRDPG